MTEIWVVRHGETPWNTVRRVQGWEDIALNAHGVNQARLLAKHLVTHTQATEPIDAIYCSDLKRAHHTAEIIAQEIGLVPQIEIGVRERNFGVLQGLIFHDMHIHEPAATKVWASRDPDGIIPNAETLRFFHQRVVDAIDQIAARHVGQRVMVVSHGGAMDIIWRHASQVPLAVERQTPIVNTSLNRIAVSPDGWKIINWGDVSHLGESALDDATI